MIKTTRNGGSDELSQVLTAFIFTEKGGAHGRVKCYWMELARCIYTSVLLLSGVNMRHVQTSRFQSRSFPTASTEIPHALNAPHNHTSHAITPLYLPRKPRRSPKSPSSQCRPKNIHLTRRPPSLHPLVPSSHGQTPPPCPSPHSLRIPTKEEPQKQTLPII